MSNTPGNSLLLISLCIFTSYLLFQAFTIAFCPIPPSLGSHSSVRPIFGFPLSFRSEIRTHIISLDGRYQSHFAPVLRYRHLVPARVKNSTAEPEERDADDRG